MPILVAAAVATAVALVAWRLQALSRSGAPAAAAVGTAVLWGAGIPGGLVLAAFFLPTSAISRVTEGYLPVWTEAKGTQRDAAQVMANGWAAALGGLVARFAPEPGLWILTGALAAAAADTWATSIGALSPRDPVLIVSGRRVRAGTSGGVSLAGTAGGMLGALVVAATGGIAGREPALTAAALVAGTVGMVADSLLGGTLQGRFRCPACDQPTERRRHRCGTATWRAGGLQWMDNDMVNAVATALAAVISWGCWSWR